MRLKDKVAVITGSGSGMGRASALLFAEHGAKVVVADIDGGKAQETANAIQQKSAKATAIQADVSKAADVQSMVDRAVETFGSIDILFNNAGYPMVPTPLEQIEEDLWNKIMDVNVKGVFLGCKAAAPIMKRQGGGVIINTASISGVRPRPGQSPYAASKAAVILLTKALAVELAPHKIRVNCINPTATETPMLPQLGATDNMKPNIIASIPLGRMAKPEDIAYAALYLASSEASMVTGTALDVDGGRGV